MKKKTKKDTAVKNSKNPTEFNVFEEERKKNAKNKKKAEDEIKAKKPARTGKKISKAKVAIAVVILLLVICYLVYFVISFIKNPTNIFVVTNGELAQEETVIGYIVREETAVKGENYKNGMVKIKSEGEKVASGDSIFRYYASGEEDIKNKIATINEEIQQIMQEEEGIFSADIKLIDNQIQSELNELYEVNSIQKIQEYKKNISSYIDKKAKISGELSPSGSYLKQLLAQKEEYEETLSSNSEYITAPVSGVVSYRIDGLEEVLNINNFESLNKATLDELNIKTGQTVASSEEMGKVINNFFCYLIFNSDSEEAKEVQTGDNLQIRLENSNVVKASVQNIIEEDDGSKTITIKITNNVEDLIAYRKISFDIIWWSAEGYRIPNTALREENGINYVLRNRNGYYNKMYVKILKQNDEYAIVQQYETEELKELGFSTTDIYNMKNIALYDEIVLNPTEEQLLQ